MKVKYVATLIAFSLMSTSAIAELRANDDTNEMEGTNGATMLRSVDNGKTWFTFETTADGVSYGLNNNFPGTQTVIVANSVPGIQSTPLYDASQTYSVAQTKVRYDGYFWTNQWWANPGEVPGVNEVWKKGEPTHLDSNILGTFYFTPWTGEKAEQNQNEQKAAIAAQRKVIGYFPEWGVYQAHNYFTPDKVVTQNITHLNYGFALVKNGVVVMHDTEKAPQLMTELKQRTEHLPVKMMISFGGWDNSQEGVFEAATATPEGTERLAQSMVDYMQQWKFDGIDIDWEYPDTEQEKAQFTSLIQTLRNKLDAVGKQSDKYFQLSAAVTTSYKNMEFINPSVTAPLLDSVNVMAYDMHGAFDPITGHNAPLFGNSKDTDLKLNDAYAMKEYNKTYGVPKNKLMMGIAYYGRGWGQVEPTVISPGLPGLFAAGSATVHGAWDDVGQTTGTNPYYILKQMAADPAYARYYDEQAKVPYLYNAQTKEFYTYDDEQSIREKVDYIQDQGFGGAIIWDLSGDTPENDLGNIVKEIAYTKAEENDVKGVYIDIFNGEKRINVNFAKDKLQGNQQYRIELDGKYVFSTSGKNIYYSYQQTSGDEINVRTGNYGWALMAGKVITVKRVYPNPKVLKTLTVTEDMLNGIRPVIANEDVTDVKVEMRNGVPYAVVDFATDKLNGQNSYVAKVDGNYIFSCENGRCYYSYRNDKGTVATLSSDETAIAAGKTITIERVVPEAGVLFALPVTAEMLK